MLTACGSDAANTATAHRLPRLVGIYPRNPVGDAHSASLLLVRTQPPEELHHAVAAVEQELVLRARLDQFSPDPEAGADGNGVTAVVTLLSRCHDTSVDG